MDRLVLDSSVVLAFINNEPGSEGILDEAADFLFSSVNLAETVGVLIRKGASLESARESIAYLDLQIVDFDRALAEETGAMTARTHSAGLSLGARACLALAARESLPAITADRVWRDIDVGVDIRLIR